MKFPFQRATSGQDDPRAEAAEDEPFSLVRFLLTFVLLAWAIRSLVIAPFNIPSGSMLPTLYIGDYLFVAKWPYGYSRYSFPFEFPPIAGRIPAGTPDRGDVVVFRHPVEGEDLIKRVIGVPGDTVEVRGGEVVLNGRPLRRDNPRQYLLPISANTPCKTAFPAPPDVVRDGGVPFCRFSTYRETLPDGTSYTVIDQLRDGPADNLGPVTVPSGHLFMMGDNRDDSADSRFAVESGGVGMLPTDRVIGRALMTFWSTDGSAQYYNPLSWFGGLRATRIGNGFSGDAE